jgi:hypothetical protein
VATTGNLLVNTGTFPTVTVNTHAVTQGGALAVQISGTASNNADSVNAQAGGIVPVAAYLYGWNQTQWDRVQTDPSNGDAVPTQTVGLLDVDAHLRVFNGTSFDRVRGSGTAVDAVATVNTGALDSRAFNYMFNGTTWDRIRGTTAGGIAVSQSNDQRVTAVGAWSVQATNSVGTPHWVTASVSTPLWVRFTGSAPVAQGGAWTVQTSGTVNATIVGATSIQVSSSAAGLLVDQSGSSTGSVTTQVTSLTGVALKAANTARAGVTLYNQSTQPWYVRLGGTASLTNFTLIVDVSGYYETPYMYNGAVWGIQASAATGLMYVTEVV